MLTPLPLSMYLITWDINLVCLLSFLKMYLFPYSAQFISWLQPCGLMWKLSTIKVFVPAKLTLVQFVFCTGYKSSDVLIVGVTFRISIPTRNSHARVQETGPQENGRKRCLQESCLDKPGQEDLQLRLLRYNGDDLKILDSISLSTKEHLSCFPFPLSLSTSQHRELHSEPLCRGRGMNGLSHSPFPLSLSTSQHRGSQHNHLGGSLSTRRCFDPANQK
jgi:hypothetical protein